MAIPGQLVHLERLSFGPTVYRAFEPGKDMRMSVRGGVTGVWRISPVQKTRLSDGALYEGGKLHMMLSGGAVLDVKKTLLSVSGFYGGLGRDDFQAYGARFGLRAVLP